MTLNKEIRVRASAADHALYERYAADRNMTVSDLVRTAVEAYCSGSVGITFAPACIFAARHTPGFSCPGCGGSTRAAA
jgi:hypothetical protein